MTDTDTSHLVRVGLLDDAEGEGLPGRERRAARVAVFWHEGRAWAVDNRCPHMGFR